MNTAVINFVTEPKLKEEAQKVARKLGIPLSLALNNYLRQLVQTKTVVFRDEIPNARLVKSINQAEKDIKDGRTIAFKSGEEALKYLDLMIKNDKQNQK